MEVAFDRRIIPHYRHAEPAFQQAVQVVAGLALDVPDGVLTYGAIGVWVVTVSWLALPPPGTGSTWIPAMTAWAEKRPQSTELWAEPACGLSASSRLSIETTRDARFPITAPSTPPQKRKPSPRRWSLRRRSGIHR